MDYLKEIKENWKLVTGVWVCIAGLIAVLILFS